MTKRSTDPESRRRDLSPLQKDCQAFIQAHAAELHWLQPDEPSNLVDIGIVLISFEPVREGAHRFFFNPRAGEWEPAGPDFDDLPLYLDLGAGSLGHVPTPRGDVYSIQIDSPEEFGDYIRWYRDAGGNIGLPETKMDVPLCEIFTKVVLPISEGHGKYSVFDLTDPGATALIPRELEHAIFRCLRKGTLTPVDAWREHFTLLRPSRAVLRKGHPYLVRARSPWVEAITPSARADTKADGLWVQATYEKMSPLFLREFFRHTVEGRAALSSLFESEGFDDLRNRLQSIRVSVPSSQGVQTRKAVEWYMARMALFHAGADIQRHPWPADTLLSDYVTLRRRVDALLE